MVFRRWWSSLSSRPVLSSRRARPRRSTLLLEALEVRVVPADPKLVSFADPSFLSSSASSNGQSEAPPAQSISDDGKFLVFASTGTDLVAGQTGTTTQNVYLYDVENESISLISHNVGLETINGNAPSFNPVISADGSTIAFFSFATDLMAGVDPGGSVQLYLYDRELETLKLVTHQPGDPLAATDASNPFIPETPDNNYGAVNTLGYYAGVAEFGILGGGIGLPSLSDDGKFVAYISNASNLIPGANIPDSTGLGTLYTEVYVYDSDNDLNTLVSHTTSSLTTGAEGYASTVAISGDSTTVAFTSPAKNLVSGATGSTFGNNDQLYVWSRVNNSTTGLLAGQTILASHKADNTALGATASGQLFGFTEDSAPSLSRDGAFIAYTHAGIDLVNTATDSDPAPQGTPSVLNVFRYDVKRNTNKLVTHAFASQTTMGDNPVNRIAALGVGPAEATGPSISSDGRYIAFANNSSNLLEFPFVNNYEGRDQVYLYDADTGLNTLVSHADGSLTNPSLTGASAPSMTPNGQYVSYIDWAYPADDANDPVTSVPANIRLYDRLASDPTIIPTSLGIVYDPSIPFDPNLQIGAAELNAALLAPTIMSANASVIVWNGTSPNVVSNDANGKIDVFIVNTGKTDGNTPPGIGITSTVVPEVADTTFATLSLNAPGTLTFTLVPGDQYDDEFFRIVGNQLTTEATFPIGGPDTTFTIRIREVTTSTERDVELTLVRVPTNVQLTTVRVPETPNLTFATITTTAEGPGRTFTTTLVDLPGYDTDLFTISNNQITTSSDFPGTDPQTQFTVRVRSTDTTFTTLFVEQDVTITRVTVPTDLNLSITQVQPTPSLEFATLTTTATPADRPFTYSLTTDTPQLDNEFFTIDGDKIRTGTNFPDTANPTRTTYTILVRTADPQYPSVFREEQFTITVLQAPTDLELSNTTVVAAPDQTVGTLSTIANGVGRTFTYSLVTGTGDDDNDLFVIAGDQLKTDSDIPNTPSATYTVRIRTADLANSNLFREEEFTITTLDGPTTVIVSVNGVVISGVPNTAGISFATLTTDVPGTFAFSLVSGLGSDDNGLFTIDGTQLLTDVDFPGTNPTQTDFHLLVRAQDTTNSSVFVDHPITLTLVRTPTDVTTVVTNPSVPALPNQTITGFTVTAQGDDREFTLSLVDDAGGRFTIDTNGQLQTSATFPGTVPSTSQFTVRVRAVDTLYPSLFVERDLVIVVVTQPTDLNLSNDQVPALPSESVGTLTTTATPGGRTFDYSLTTDTDQLDNEHFTVDRVTGELKTDSDFPTTSTQTTYTVGVRTADPQFPSVFFEETFTITVLVAPTDLILSNDDVAAAPGRFVGTLSTEANGTGRTFSYSFVAGPGDGGNDFFTLDPITGELRTDSTFPSTVGAFYTIRARTTDDDSGLFRDETFEISTTTPVDTLPEIVAPTDVATVEGTAALLNLTALVEDPTVVEVTSVVISNVPADATLSAGTDNGDGTWTVPANQLTGLTITVADNLTTTLEVVAVAEVINEDRTIESEPVEVVLAVSNVAPTLGASGSGVFDPTDGSVALNLAATDPGEDSVDSVTVNWGDGTIETFAGMPGTVEHTYAITDSTYQVTVMVTDEDGSYALPTSLTYDAEFDTQTTAVVAELYQDVLGRNADLGGLMNFTQLVNAGASFDTVIEAMLSSPEYQSHVVNDLYVRYLGRDADPSGMTSGVAFLTAGGDPRELAARLVASEEFFNAAGGSNEGYLRALYLIVLGREIDPTGLESNLALLPTTQVRPLDAEALRQLVALEVIKSAEARLARAEEFYQEYLNRQGDPGGVAAHAEALARQSEVDLAMTFLTSSEYQEQFETQ